MAAWNADQYLKFARERTQPSIDLVSRIPASNPTSVLDVGCGPGNSTRVLRERWPDARIVGLDNSPEMIARARSDFPDGEWLLADAATLSDSEQYDVVFSNAVLQWIPNYERLLPQLMRIVAPSGCLAVQVPANSDSPIHKALMSVAGSTKWSVFTASCGRRPHYRSPCELYGALNKLGRVALWETTYYHILQSHKDLIEWYKSTGMRPFLETLPDDRCRARFEEEVLQECMEGYPVQNDGKVLYPFKRVFFIVTK